MKQFTYLLLLLSPFFVLSQKRLDLVHEKAFTFYDYQEKVICALDDSTFIWKYNAKKEKWEKSPIELMIDLPFIKFLSDFVPMSEQGTPVYFVSVGCGVVYVKNGNTIKRHDHSFYHMNQFGGVYFMDQGEPRIYGGYGLFTSKNIITRYDTTEREWFAINTGITSPPAGIRGLIKKSNNHYYIFDGFRGIGTNYFYQDRVWSLDLQTLKWKNIGKLNPKIQEKREEGFYELFRTIRKGYSCFENDIVSYDFEKMRYKKYKIKQTNLYKKIIQVDSLFLIRKMTSQHLSFILISDSTFLKQFDCEEGEIILKETNSLFSVLIITFGFITLLILFILWQLKKRRTLLIKRKNKMQNTLLIEADEFNQTELELLQLLFTH